MSFSLKMLFFGIVIVSIVLTMPSIFADSWYVGKGLKQGDYFSYNICWEGWHNCSPFQINFWIKNETSDGTGWNVLIEIADYPIIQKGVMTIGKITPDPTSVDRNISDFPVVYENTVSWLTSFATSDKPMDINSPRWGNLGGLESRNGVIGQEQVIVPAGTFNTWVFGWHKGVDNKIWVDPNIAFPVKAIVYGDLTAEKATLDYTFELLKTGNNPNEPQIWQGSFPMPTELSPQTPNNMSKIIPAVPEFGSLAGIIMMISLSGVLILSRKFT